MQHAHVSPGHEPVTVTITFGIPHAAQHPHVGVSPAPGNGHSASADAPRKRGRPPKKAPSGDATQEPATNGGGPSKRKGRAATNGRSAAKPDAKIVFDVKPGVRQWLEDKLQGGPAGLDDLAAQLSQHAISSTGGDLPDERKFMAARRALRMYGVNPKVGHIQLDGDQLSLTPSKG